MAYNEKLADRILEVLAKNTKLKIEEKKMFGGIAFMVDSKMCVGVLKDDLMCRIDAEKNDEVLSKAGCRPMDFVKRPMKGYYYVDETGYKKSKDLEYWIKISLEFNPQAKAAKKKGK